MPSRKDAPTYGHHEYAKTTTEMTLIRQKIHQSMTVTNMQQLLHLYIFPSLLHRLTVVCFNLVSPSFLGGMYHDSQTKIAYSLRKVFRTWKYTYKMRRVWEMERVQHTFMKITLKSKTCIDHFLAQLIA